MALLKQYTRFVIETRSHIADTFCQFLKLNNDTMRYNKLAKRVTKDASVRFQIVYTDFDLSTLFVDGSILTRFCPYKFYRGKISYEQHPH